MSADNQQAVNQGYLRTKSVETILKESEGNEKGLKRVLGPIDLTAMGVGAIIGAGIFVLTGLAARDVAGPGIMLSYAFAGVACILSAFCYAEFAARLPISGSAYTYAYACVGEIVAWIIGWDLILEYTIGASTVAVSWVEYLKNFFIGMGIPLPESLLVVKIGALDMNLFAFLAIVFVCVLLCVGIKESARFNAVMVAVKLVVILFVIVAGIPWVNPSNWQPFLPMGVPSIFQGAAAIFFAYIGFDAVSTAAEEVKNPKRDLPIGIIASLLICTILYITVAAVITGMVPYPKIDAGAPLAAAFGTVGNVLAQKLISVGGVVGLLTVMLILLLSQSRIYFSMARDGLLPKSFQSIHPVFRTPVTATVCACSIAALMAAFVPLKDLHHMVNIGTLFAFVIVCCSMLIARYQKPGENTGIVPLVLWMALSILLLCFGISDVVGHSFILDLISSPNSTRWVIEEALQLPIRMGSLVIGFGLFVFQMGRLLKMPSNNKPSTFSCPAVPWVPVIAIFANFYMMINLDLIAWVRVFVWLIIGLCIYNVFGRQSSKLNA